MSGRSKSRAELLKERAAQRSLGLRPGPEPPYGWELDNGHNVLACGSLDVIDEWLTRTEQEHRP
uniref:hypothetical protein n=1 Tax=Micromonospora sp. NBC_00855 TaxID=2975978 RepID=UPI00224E6C30|nr:hypothetical protein OHB51_35285 [Micromonospora sp. NBC_00855]